MTWLREEEIAAAVEREVLRGEPGEMSMEQMAALLEANPAAEEVIQGSVTAAIRAAQILRRKHGTVPPAALEATILSMIATGVAIGMRIGQLRWCPETGALRLMPTPENKLLSEEERKTVREMLDAAVRHFRKRRAKEKRELDARSVYKAFQDEAGNMLQEGADESGSGL